MFLGSIPSISFIKSSVKLNEYCSCSFFVRFLCISLLSYSNSMKHAHGVSFNNPSSSMIKSLLKSVEHASGIPWTTSCTCLNKIFIGTNGKLFSKFFFFFTFFLSFVLLWQFLLKRFGRGLYFT